MGAVFVPSRSEILDALQYEIFNVSNPINRASNAPYRITYQYAGTSQPGDLPISGSYTGWTPWTAAERSSFETALRHMESLLNVRFVEVSGSSDPDINVGQVSLPGAVVGNGGYSVSYWSANIVDWDGFVVFDSTYDLVNGSLGIVLHELSHAMGLQHGHDTDILSSELACPVCGGSHDPDAEITSVSDTYETTKYTVMSYNANPDTGDVGDELMLFDVVALQDIWGHAQTNTGNTRYTGPQTDHVDLIWDTGGWDALDARSNANGVSLDLRPGAFSQFGDHEDMVIAYGVRIEAAFGSDFDDTLIGNTANNYLGGEGGNDTIIATGGNNEMWGGSGDDTMTGAAGRDRLTGEEGNDTIFGGAGGDLLAGWMGDDVMHGQGGTDHMYGGKGDDILFGGDGRDLIVGGAGSDILSGGHGADHFLFRAGSERDQITDFGLGADLVFFYGCGTIANILDQAEQVGSDVVFDFGDGDVLVIDDTSLDLVSRSLALW